jgi:hypothetical protein
MGFLFNTTHRLAETSLAKALSLTSGAPAP